MKNLINCIIAEWLKKRKSLASWLVVIGGLFMPFLSIIIFLVYPNQLITLHKTNQFWQLLFLKSWQMMAFIFLPMGIVLAVSLITQLETKNNTWKQLHTTPLSFTSIFFAKLIVLLFMLIQLFIIFNIGIVISAYIPALLKNSIPFPTQTFSFNYVLKISASFFMVSLPMVALQYLISLKFKNFLIPIGIGLALVIGGMIALNWQYGYTLPSAYTSLLFLQLKDRIPTNHNLHIWSLVYFSIFTLAGYLLYYFKKEKG